MMNLSKHLSNKVFFIFFFLLVFFGCSKEVKKSNEIVRIKDAVLTEDELTTALGEKSNNAKLREQFINEWIEREVLYQKAVEEGIIKDKEFNSILERSKKELAAAFLINKILSENMISPDEAELRDYYELLKDDFRLLDDLYRINIIYFNNFDDAVKFRSILIESGWDKALNAFNNTPSVVSTKTDNLYYGYQLQPASLARIISFMLPREISVVLEVEKNKFAVFQLVEKFDKEIIPPFEVIKEKVKERYQVVKNKEFIQNYIEELISDYDVEIKRQ